MSPEPGPENSRLEFWVRAVCGAQLGLLIGFYFCVHLHPSAFYGYVLILVASVVGCAWGAVKNGDDFWRSLGRF